MLHDMRKADIDNAGRGRRQGTICHTVLSSGERKRTFPARYLINLKSKVREFGDRQHHEYYVRVA